MSYSDFDKHRSLVISLLFLAGVLVLTAMPMAAADQVPFKMTLNLMTTSIAPNPDACGTGSLVNIVGNGNATELGRFTDTQHHCIYPDSLVFDNGHFVFTAANGDLLVGSYHGFLTPTGNPTVFDVHGQWVVTGGTGRFANATGSGVASGSLNAETGLVNLKLDGTISHP